MKIKALSFAVLSSLLLTACGGGGSDSSNTNVNGTPDNNNPTDNGQNPSTTSDQSWSSFFIDQIYSDSDDGVLGSDEDHITIKDGKYYAKNTNTLNEDDLGHSIIITQNGVYEDGDVHAEYGTYIGTAKIDNNKWTLTPYSKTNSSGLQFIHSYKSIDISGKPFNEVINPQDAWAIRNNLTNTYPISNTLKRFYTTNNATRFPEGSTCLRLDTIENTQEYIELQLDTENDKNVQKIWEREAAKTSDTDKKIFKDTVAYITYQYEDADTYAKYQSKFFSGNYYSKGLEFSLAEFIDDLKQDANNYTGQNKEIADDYIDAYKNTCLLFNETASKAIRTTISNFK